MDDIEPIMCTPPPFGLDDKIFYINDEDGNCLDGPFSYNDCIQMIKNVSGVSPELLGESI